MITLNELKWAMQYKVPVIACGIKYRYIDHYILRISENGEQHKSAALLDMNGRSVVIYPLEQCCIAEN